MANRKVNIRWYKSIRHWLYLTYIAVACIFLTIVSQVGGLVFLLSLPAFFLINKKTFSVIAKTIYKTATFIALYILICFVIIPPIAKHFGRVRLKSSSQLQSASNITRWLNRDYVTPEMQKVLADETNKMHTQYGVTTYYLDACFPFRKGFPLLPHLSHNNGKKVDLAFYYTSPQTGKQQHGSPSPIGYGVGEPPRKNEIQQAEICKQKGYWQYSFIQNLIGRFRKSNYAFDETKTKQMVELILKNAEIGKVFIEPHLANRMGIKNPKLKFQGCHSVRHDDHIHIQLK